jgi:hypothetical protein
MTLFEDAKQLLEDLRATPDFLAKAALKARHLQQGDYTFDGTRWAKLAFRLGPRLAWSPETWREFEQIAREYGLTIACGHLAHLRDGPVEVASIRDLGENVIAIHPDYARGGELLEALGRRLFGASSGDGREPG